jgi:serine/threonine protein kinase/Tfp pilus assembly protein PilF
MPEPILTIDEPLSSLQALLVSDACERFAAAWRSAGPSGTPPRIEEHLGDTPEPVRLALLRHLILLDIGYRRQRGQSPTAEDYQSRFQHVSSVFLDDVFAAPVAQQAAAAAEKPAAKEVGAEPEGGPADVQTTVLPRPVAPAMRSARYVIRQFHARGGIGEIWLAEDVEIGREVALKRLRQKREEAQDRFLAEAQITGQLEHPGIVPVHDLGLDEEGRPFYVMTFIHGQTLQDAIAEYHAGKAADKEPAEVRLCRLLEIFVKVCQALAYAHSRGVFHRDLKPDNVMLGAYGETLVLDWGMAKVRHQPEDSGSHSSVHLSHSSGSTETQAGAVMGSPAYMAPEAAEGRAAEADERTDVYLLGATLYAILTGRPPRQGSSRAEIVELARAGPPPPPRKLKADVPRALEAICLKAMAHRKQDRYASAVELARDMQRYLAGAPVSAYPEPVLARVGRWCKRHRRILVRSVAAALLIAALGLLAVVQVYEARKRAEAARREADEFRRHEQARQDLDQARRHRDEFHRLAEERQFYTALTAPSGERHLHYDSGRGREAGERALAMVATLTSELNYLPRAEQQAVQEELHDFLLLMVQAQIQQSPEPKAVPAMLEHLARAASLSGPSRGHHRLLAKCYELLGDDRRAAAEAQRAPELPETTLDHFLQAEQYRTEAISPTAARGDRTDWQPNGERLARATEHYKQALQINPRHYWCYFQLGRCYLSLGQGSEAIEALTTCVALRPEQPWGYSARGLARGLTRHFAQGEADLEKALTMDPDFRPALLNRGILAWLQTKEQRALDDFGKVLEPPEHQRLIEAAYYRGQLHLERGRRPEAMADFDRVVQENPGFRPVYLSRAQVHFLQGDDIRGLADLTKFLDLARPKPLDPKSAEVLALRGRLLRHLVPKWGLAPTEERAKLQLAQTELSKAIQLGGRGADLFDDLGSVLELQGEPEKAIPIYEQAMKTAAPRLKVKVLLQRGWVYAQSLNPPRPDKARDDFTEVLRLDPGNAYAHTGLGYLWACRQRPAEAQREAAQAMLHGAGDIPILHNVACIYAELSRIDKGQANQHADMAMTLIHRAVELWRRGGAGQDEMALIRAEPSFKPLRTREDFRKLLAPEH